MKQLDANLGGCVELVFSREPGGQASSSLWAPGPDGTPTLSDPHLLPDCFCSVPMQNVPRVFSSSFLLM